MTLVPMAVAWWLEYVLQPRGHTRVNMAFLMASMNMISFFLMPVYLFFHKIYT